MSLPRFHAAIIMILLSLSLISCVLSPEKKIDSVYVMVYDYENNEVMNVSISIDGKKIGTTDIYGRLIITPDDEKESTVRAEKDGYESVETKAYIRPGQLVYFRMGTGAYYAKMAEQLLDGDEPDKALELIDRALEIQDRKDWRYLRSVILRRLSDE